MREPTVLEIGGRRIGGEHFSLIAGPCTVESRDQVLTTAARRSRRRRLDVPRRRLQAALLAVLLPGARPGGPAAARRGARGDRPADRHRADGRARHRARARGRRRDPGRRPQHAELRAAERDRPLRQADADQARPVLDARGAADGGGVHPQGGQPERDPVRARDPDVRDGLPLHAGHHRDPGAEGDDPPAGDRRPQPRARPAQPRPRPVDGRRRGRGRRDHRRGAPRARGGDLRRPAAAPHGRARRVRRAPGAGGRGRRQGALPQHPPR